MKKFIKTTIIMLSLLAPINVFAYSDYIIPGGENVGIEVKYNGVLVIGFYKIDGEYNKNDIEVGDYITHVENTEINSVDELVNNIEKFQNAGKVKLKIKRNNKLIKSISKKLRDRVPIEIIKDFARSLE